MDPLSKLAHDGAIYAFQPQAVTRGPPPEKPFVIETPEKANKAEKDKESKEKKDEEEL